MRHETFPNIPSNSGAFFNNPKLKTDTLETIARTPDEAFISKVYVRTPPLTRRLAIHCGISRPPGLLAGCGLVHLAFGGHFRESYPDIIRIGDDDHAGGGFRTEALLPYVKKKLNIVFPLAAAIEQAYEKSHGGRATLHSMVEAIPLAMPEDLQAEAGRRLLRYLGDRGCLTHPVLLFASMMKELAPVPVRPHAYA